MLTFKRTLILMAVLALAIGGLGVASTSAQSSRGAWLGVQIKDTDGGVSVEDVTAGSPAETAGLKVGDVITSVDGEAVESAEQFVKTIQSHQSGDEVTLAVVTGDETHDVKVTLGERPADLDQQAPSTGSRPGFEGVLDFLGLSAQVTDQGLEIKSIAADSPFADSGLQEGDIVTAINGETIDTNSVPGGWMRLLRADTNPITLTVLRDGQSQDIEVTLDWSTLGVPNSAAGGMTMPQPTQLGVRFRTLTAEIADQDSLPVNEGAQVLEVYADSPAEKAGLQKDDIITAVDGDKVDEEHTLADRLYAYEEGDTVTLAVQRGTETVEIEVTLGPKASDGWFGMMPGMDGSMMPFGNGRNGQGWFDFHVEPGQPNQAPEAPATEAAPSNPA